MKNILLVVCLSFPVSGFSQVVIGKAALRSAQFGQASGGGGGGGSYDPATDSSVVEWLKADAITGASDGAQFGTWQHSKGQDATQATTALKPVYLAAFQNGLPVVAFTNRVTGSAMATATFGTLTQPYWVMYSFQHYALGPSFAFDGISTPERAAEYFSSGDGTDHGYAGNDVSLFTPDLNKHILYVLYNGASSKWAIDGGALNTWSCGTDTLTGITLGNKYDQTYTYSDLFLGEKVVGTGTPSDVPAKFTYFNGRWAVF